jgi:2-oxoglutarate dehydrogenase E2 component (dihydrolipoamide succinyltransferase)
VVEIEVPKFNSNDVSYILTDWLFKNGQWVPPGAAVAVVETSKAAQELVGDQGGLLHQVMALKSECRCGDIIGYMFASEEERQRFLAESPVRPAASSAADSEPVMTAPARRLAEQLGITNEALRQTGKRVIREADVERLVAGSDTGLGIRRQPLNRNQQAVAGVVSESHRTIPAAFTAVKIEIDTAQAFAARLAADSGKSIGLPELLVKAMADLQSRFPLFTAARIDNETVALPDGAHIGVTIDVGKGLFVPVVRHAERLSVSAIADALMQFRADAIRSAFRAEDLAGANIVLALNNQAGIVLAVPLIFPGHACAVSLAAPQDKVVLDERDGRVAVRSVVTLGLAYDHRIINGRDAALFLQAIGSALASPEQLARAPG